MQRFSNACGLLVLGAFFLPFSVSVSKTEEGDQKRSDGEEHGRKRVAGGAALPSPPSLSHAEGTFCKYAVLLGFFREYIYMGPPRMVIFTRVHLPM